MVHMTLPDWQSRNKHACSVQSQEFEPAVTGPGTVARYTISRTGPLAWPGVARSRLIRAGSVGAKASAYMQHILVC